MGTHLVFLCLHASFRKHLLLLLQLQPSEVQEHIMMEMLPLKARLHYIICPAPLGGTMKERLGDSHARKLTNLNYIEVVTSVHRYQLLHCTQSE